MFHRSIQSIRSTGSIGSNPARRLPAALLALLAVLGVLGGATGTAWAGPVNVNAADAATLAEQLKGVGKVKAQALVEFRQKHGPFRSVDELAQVHGFGQKLIERNRADLKLGPVGAASVAATAARPGTATTAAPARPPAAAATPARR